MNQEIKPLTAILLLALFAAILGGKFWANGEAKAVRTFSFMHEHPSNGNAYILLDKQLFGFDTNGNATEQIDLTRFDVDDNLVTDFAFFSNGDLLLRRHVAKHDFVYNLQRHFRFTNLQQKVSENNNLGLFRCDPKTYSCQPFTAAPLNLNDAFGLAVDWHNDRVFISDSSRHTLYLYSADGTELDTAKGFLFPNQIRYRDGKLYVADTNHHQLAVLQIEEKRFGKKLEAMDTRAGPAKASGEIWPAAFLLLGDQRWILNAKNNMGYGGIYVFDNEAYYQKRLNLPESADPISLLQLGDTVLVCDYSRGTIYRFNLLGETLADFQPSAMQPLLKTLNERRQNYQSMSRLFTALFVVGLAGGFATALYRQRKTDAGAITITPQTTVAGIYPLDLNDTAIYWLKPTLKFKLMVVTAVIILLFVTALLPLFHWFSGVSWQTFSLQYVLLSIGTVLITIILLSQLRKKIGITENDLIVVPQFGSPVICSKDKLVYSDVIVAADKTFLNILQLSKMFPADDVEQRLYPFIKQGHRIEQAEMRSLLFSQKTVIWFSIILIALLLGIFLYLNAKTI